MLELGLIQRRDRQRFYERVDDAGFELVVHVVDADREVRRERVRQRNRQRGETFAVEVPDDFFELASDMWQAPDDAECEGRDVRWVLTDA